MSKYFYLVITLLITTTTLAVAQKTITFQSENMSLDISEFVYIYRDTTQKLSFKDILQIDSAQGFVLNNQKSLNFGRTGDAIWLKFIFKNDIDEKVLLEIKNPLIQYLDFYTLFSNSDYQHKKLGTMLPFKERYYQTNNFVFPLANAKTTYSSTFYLRITSNVILPVPISIKTSKTYIEESHKSDALIGIYTGIVLIISLYNLFIFFTIRDFTYLYYFIYVVLIGLFNASLTGYAFNFLWSSYPAFNQYVEIFITIPLVISVGLFSIYFLDTAKRNRLFHHIILVFLGIFIFNIFIVLINHVLAGLITQAVSAVFFDYLLVISIILYFRGFKNARFYIFAWVFFIAGTSIFIAMTFSLLPINFFTYHAVLIGSAFEITFFSFALADKINTYKKDKEKAQEENLRLVKKQNEMLESKVKERTIELESANNEILTQNEELHQQQEELTTINETLEVTLGELKTTTNRLNKSIQYAYNIQQIILPKKYRLDTFFHSHFSIYLPKDVVSGDFYWFMKCNDSQAIFVLADCTGHGVPGAFMSMIGNTLLREIVKTKNIADPAHILSDLNEGINDILKQDESQNNDGMDISICLFEKNITLQTYQITFSGAKNNIFYSKDEQIEQLYGDRVSIGGLSKNTKIFTNQTFTLKAGETIYFTSDGYIDQHNSERKRFGTQNFKALLTQVKDLDIREQKQLIFKTLEDYQKKEEQRDDISVVGIKL